MSSFAYGPEPDQVLDVLWPTIDTIDGPAVVYLHSGGWTAGSRANIPDFLLAELARGWTIVSIDYRLAPAHPFPAANFDADRALRWTKRHAEALGIDPDQVVLAGGSAGGHLATTAAAAPGRFRDPALPADLLGVDPRPAALLALVAPTDLTVLLHTPGWGAPLTAGYLACPSADGCPAERLHDASPFLHVTAPAPPALFIYGELDTLVPTVPHGTAIATAWSARGQTATVITVANTGHNLDRSTVDQTTIDVFLDAIRR